MAKDKLRRVHLTKDDKKGDWKLQEAGSDRAIRRFPNKEGATAGGVLADALGSKGGSVRIHKQDGKIQEERTYPRSKDPKSSPG
ncbi:MAG: DUF2188 domain-containing protein [Pseudomonadota bacterium]